MKILGGTVKGHKLLTSKRTELRPALARVRNSLFNILGSRIIDKYVLDLFAGTGSLGLEALSRGAKFCLFIDNNRTCLEIINQNISVLGFTDRASTVLLNGFKISSYLISNPLSFDIIFVAPPYRFFAESRLKRKLLICLEELVQHRFLSSDNSLVIIEHRQKQIKADEFNTLKQVDHRSYGQTELTFLSRKHSDKS